MLILTHTTQCQTNNGNDDKHNNTNDNESIYGHSFDFLFEC